MKIHIVTRGALAVIAAVAPFAMPLNAATYYVDPTGGTVSSDDYDGTAETWEGGGSTVGPKKTLAAALKDRASGDVVIALPGTYAEGVSNPEDMNTTNALNRVRVPAGVTLMSRDGAESTVIMGAEAPNPLWKGCGTNAVRCASVADATTKPKAPRARLIGFTLTGGRTSATGAESDKNGGAASGGGYCVDCIVSNNAAFYRGGASSGATFVRSRFLGDNDCKSAVGYSLYGGTAIYCLVKNNASFSTTLVGCTYISAFPRNAKAYNSLLMSTGSAGGNPVTAYRCIVVGNPISNFTFEDGSYYTNSTAVALGADGVPEAGSVALDFGNSEYLESKISEAEFRLLDLSGEKRIANGRLDAGCFEYDWYDEFSAALSPVGAAAVTNATSHVELSGECLSIPTNGAANVLLKPFNNGESLYSFFVEVTGTGTLSVYLDGASEASYTFTAADGEVETKLTLSEEKDARFVYSGTDGNAKLSRFSNVSYACILAAQKGIALDGGVAVGTNYVASGQTLTFTVSRAYDSDVVCTGIDVNGEFLPFDGHPEGYSITVSDADRNTSVSITAVYKDGLRDWYVDANHGDDTNTGLYTNNAFKTLKMAVENPKYATGEVIWAMPGDYNDKVCTNAPNDTLSRAAIKAGMILRSMEGAEKTIIRGAASTDGTAADNGCGPGAVRCVHFLGSAVVEGFTITDGRSLSNTSTTYDISAGGGAVCQAGGVLVDCVISNNHARSGGALYGGTVIRGRLFKNGGTYGSDAFSATRFIDSYLANDRANYYNLYSNCSCYNCTFGPTGHGPRKNCSIYNSILPNHTYSGTCNSKFYNCVMAVVPADNGGSTLSDCTITNDAAMDIGDGYRPKADTAMIDAGNWEYYALITNTLKTAGIESLDLLGGQRIYNGRIDVGCGEFDWRDAFAKKLSYKGVSVLTASENVATNDLSGLDIAAGQSLKLGVVLTFAGDVSFALGTETPAEVSVLVDGVSTEIGAGGRVAFRLEAGDHTVEIVCSDDGQATVSNFLMPKRGFVFIVN